MPAGIQGHVRKALEVVVCKVPAINGGRYKCHTVAGIAHGLQVRRNNGGSYNIVNTQGIKATFQGKARREGRGSR